MTTPHWLTKQANRGVRVLAVMAVFLGLAWTVKPAWQAPLVNFTVTKGQDTNDGACNSDCSLREAIIAANLTSGPDTIQIPAGAYTVTIHTLINGSASPEGAPDPDIDDLDITDDVTITGAGALSTTIDGNGIDRIFDVFSPAHVTLVGVTIRNGSEAEGGGIKLNPGAIMFLNDSTLMNNTSTGKGGGILVDQGFLSMNHITLTSNSAADGGGVANTGGAVHILNSSISNGNTASSTGGGLFNDNGFGLAASIFVTNSLIANNSTAGNGGGFFNDGVVNGSPTATVSLVNTTVTSNTASSTGGGIRNNGTLYLANVTLANNVSTSGGGGLRNAGTATIQNTLLANNNSNCNNSGTATSQGYNLLTDSTCTSVFTQTGDLPHTPIALGLLLDNGGPTLTHALLVGSVAVDAGNPAGCTSPFGVALTIDQRGFPRTVDGDGSSGARCDIGAYELAAGGATSTPSPSPTSTPSSTPTSTPTASPSSTPTATPTATSTLSPTPTSTRTLTPTATSTRTPTATVTPVGGSTFKLYLPLIRR